MMTMTISPTMQDQLTPARAALDAYPVMKHKQKPYRTKQLLLVMLALIMGWHGWMLVQLFVLRIDNPEMSAFMQQTLDDQRMQNPNAVLDHRPIDYNRISTHLKRAVIASEDARFIQHNGFDWNGIKIALEKNFEARRVKAGGSTISQQLVKNLFLSDERSILRKAEETIITVMLELMLPKQRILELYLNYAEWGNGIYGAEAAARHHFGVSASKLTAWQAARLAAILPNPRFYDGNRTDRMYKKSEIILHRMSQARIPG